MNDRLSLGAGDELGCILDTATRQQHIREAMRWSWKGYRAFAWGQDELLPHSHSSNRWFGLGLTLVDSLDTLHIMGLEQELAEAREWVARNLILDQVGCQHLSSGLRGAKSCAPLY